MKSGTTFHHAPSYAVERRRFGFATAASERFFLAAASVTPIPILKLEGSAAMLLSGVEIGGRNVNDAVRDAIARGASFEHCGGEQRPCGLFQLLLSAVPS